MLKRAKCTLIPGFLGSAEDYKEVMTRLDFSAHSIELPIGNTWEERASKLNSQIEGNTLIGYSMGGRLALMLGFLGISKVNHIIAISAHPGLDEVEKKARCVFEKKWLTLLQEKPLDLFLKLWYDQPLFDELRKSQIFPSLLLRREQIDREKALRVFSDLALSKQPSLWGSLRDFKSRLTFIFGEKDKKFIPLHSQLSSIGMKTHLIDTGHAPHLENPEALASMINKLCRSDL